MRYKIFYGTPRDVTEIPPTKVFEAPSKIYRFGEPIPKLMTYTRTIHLCEHLKIEDYDPEIGCHYGWLKLNGKRIRRAKWSQWRMEGDILK